MHCLRIGEKLKNKLLSEKEINMIRGKMLGNQANKQEVNAFMEYVDVLETLLDAADEYDYHGTEGWRRHIGWD
jgi:hypothetical protein